MSKWSMAASVAAGAVLLACSSASNSPSSAQPSTPVVQANVTVSAVAVREASPSAASPLQIAQVQVRQDDTTVTIQNTGGPTTPTALDLSGWNLQVGTVKVELPSGTRLPPGSNLIIHAGPSPNGSPSPAPTAATPSRTPIPSLDVYLGQAGAPLKAALQPGASLQLIDPKNVVVSEFTLP